MFNSEQLSERLREIERRAELSFQSNGFSEDTQLLRTLIELIKEQQTDEDSDHTAR